MWWFLANLDFWQWLFLSGCSWLALVVDCAIDLFVVIFFFFLVVGCIILL